MVTRRIGLWTGRLLRKLGRLRRDQRGASAVEFAIIAGPFLGLCAAVLQAAFTIWAGQNFDRALQITVRDLFTGKFQIDNAGETSAATLLGRLQTKMCGSGPTATPTIFNCANVKFDVTTATSFAAATVPSPLNSSTGDWNTSFGSNYTCPNPGAIVVVTAAVKFPSFFGRLGLGFQSFADGSHLLVATSVFRTEPYQTAASVCS